MTGKLELVEAPSFSIPLAEPGVPKGWRGFTKLTAIAKSERRSLAFSVNDALENEERRLHL